MISSLLTIKQKIEIASAIKEDWSVTSNTYVGIGRVAQWSTGDTLIPRSNNSIETINQVFDNLIAIKKITESDMALVIPRIDWTISTKYCAYDNNLDMYSKETQIPLSNGSIYVSSGTTTIVGTDTTFQTDFNVGDKIEYIDTSTNASEIKEIVMIDSETSMNVNSVPNFASLTTSEYYSYYDNYPTYSNPFYVRNTYDQVFKCLANNNGALSTSMPEISLGGSLPQNPYIIMGDGYKWKYMYTIPSGLKKKFFTNTWMPVVRDLAVSTAAVDGSIDIIKINNGGSDYNGGVACSNSTILTVNGNGSGANLSAVVDSSGTITDITILDGGSGYTYATVSVDPGSAYGSGANLVPVISPHGGNGSDPSYELGATTFMLCLELSADEYGTIPVSSSGGSGVFDYHQISIIRGPKTSANTFLQASNSSYSMSKTIVMNPFSVTSFVTDDIVYQTKTGLYQDAFFTASIVSADSSIRQVYLNNIRGTFDENESLRTVGTGVAIAPTGTIESDIEPYTGDVLFIENRPSVARAVDQTEQIKLLIEI